MSTRHIFFDFDGVIMDSMPVRTDGFRKVLSNFPDSKVEMLIEYHLKNGGLSRYNKFQYFFDEIIGVELTETHLYELCESFSKIMKETLCNAKLLINEVVEFIEDNYKKHPMYVVSGSDENELNFLCKELGLSKYFIEIKGSPIIKKKNLVDLIDQYSAKNSVMIGDSINDYEAAEHAGIKFYGYNNPKLDGMGDLYLHDFSNLESTLNE